MPRQPEVHFRLKPNNKESKQLIFLDFAYSKQRLRYSFGQFVKPTDWSFSKERVKNKQATTDNGQFLLNELLDTLKEICETTFTSSMKDGVPKTDILRSALNTFITRNHPEHSSGDTPQTFFKLIENFVAGKIKIASGKHRGRDKGTSCLKNYKTTYNRLKEFETKTGYSVNFDTVNKDFYNGYVDFLAKNKALKPNTIEKEIATIKVFMNEAVEQEIATNLYFKKKSFSYSGEECEHVALDEQELHILYTHDFSHNKRLEQVRDLFVFGAYTGLRFSDFSSVRPENIKKIEGKLCIEMITQKTKELVMIPCGEIVLEIIQKYKHNTNQLPKAPTIQKFNAFIKETCSLAGLTEKGRLTKNPNLELWQTISSHTCRRSFVTNLYLQGFPAIELMKITGHRTESSFLKYVKVSKRQTALKLSKHMESVAAQRKLRIA